MAKCDNIANFDEFKQVISEPYFSHDECTCESYQKCENLRLNYTSINHQYKFTGFGNMIVQINKLSINELKMLSIEMYNMIRNTIITNNNLDDPDECDETYSNLALNNNTSKKFSMDDLRKLSLSNFNKFTTIQHDDAIFQYVNQYIIVEKIGQGSQGKVYLAFDETTNVKYAIKIIDNIRIYDTGSNSKIDSIKKEIAIMKNLKHDNIIGLIEVIINKKERKIYIVMPYVEFGRLLNKIDDGGNSSNTDSKNSNSRYSSPNGHVSPNYEHIVAMHEKPARSPESQAFSYPHNLRLKNNASPQQLHIRGTTIKNSTHSPSYSPLHSPELKPKNKLPRSSLQSPTQIPTPTPTPPQHLPRLPQSPRMSPHNPPTNTNTSDPDRLIIYQKLPMIKVIKYTKQLISSLRYLHANNIIHRDIKPENIFLDNDDKIYLSDFGVSEILMSNNNLSTQRTGTIMFFAPELFLLDNNVNGFSTDVWALGITIFLMVHGYFPFNGATYNELKYNVIHHPPLYPDNINDTQHDFFDKILHKDPMKRATLRQLKGHSFLVYAKYKENEDIAIGTTNDATRNNTHDDTHDDTRNATNDAKLEDTADNNNSGSVNTTAYVNKDSVSSIASTIPHKSQCETKERENNTEIHFNLSIENNPENPLISIDPIINLELSNSNNALHNYKFLENDAKDSANQFGYSSYDPPYLASTPMAFDHRNSSVIGMVGQPTDEEISNAIFEIGDAVSDADKNMR